MLLQFYVISETDVDLLSSRIEAGLIPTVNEECFVRSFQELCSVPVWNTSSVCV